MVVSKYLTIQQEWFDRINAMQCDLSNGDYDWLYFKIVLNLNDARDNADFDREQIFKSMLAAYKRKAWKQVDIFLNKLRGMK